MPNNTTLDYTKIIKENIPMIDVRAPIEFSKGAFPNTINLPIMNDDERKLVGTCYKQVGHDAAVELGHQLVCGEIKNKRIEAWKNFIELNPECIIYCFRGGMRSRLAQSWIKSNTNYDIKRLEEGYKGFRNFLIDYLDKGTYYSIPIVLGGFTGSGKTVILNNFSNMLDLEKIANHRGSSFGGFINSQPTQINFESQLAYDLFNLMEQSYKYVFLEDEGRNIGRSFIPKKLKSYFDTANLVILDSNLDYRTNHIYEEYVVEAQNNYINHFKDDLVGFNNWCDQIRFNLTKIRKRLGQVRFNNIMDVFEKAVIIQNEKGNKDAHKEWVHLLLVEYYDPMYNYQIENTHRDILFRGNSIEVKEFLTNLSQS